jgi:hypothetical protein
MIRVIYVPQCQGNYWLEYGPEDEWAVMHFLCGNSWDPDPKEVRRFITIASMHHVFVEEPTELTAIS